MRSHRILPIFVCGLSIFSGTLFFSGCASLPPAGPSVLRPEHCYGGLPVLQGSLTEGVRLIVRRGYSLLHSAVAKTPRWVCAHVKREELEAGGRVARKNKFRPDPELSPRERSELSDYRGSGFDRGHLVPAGDYRRSQSLKDETFYLSNMAPQKPGLNRKVWKRLEEQVRDWARSYGSVHVFTAGFCGRANCETIGKNRVQVPSHFYKIVVRQLRNGKTAALGFVLENREYEKPYRLDDFIRSIDWIEEQVGIDFLSELSDREEHALEAALPSLWRP